jgi:glucose dehydrogenase
MSTVETDVAIVGSGISGALVARALLRAGRSVTMLERGGVKTHAEQLRDRRYDTDAPGAQPNHETAPGTPPYPWNYVRGVGGSSLHWYGATPRLHANDFRMRSAYGVMTDWPIGLDELLPYYREAEEILGIAGAPGGSQPPHPFSPQDRLVGAYLGPLEPAMVARPTRPIGSRPACCGATTCGLCPVDSRFSVLNALGDVLEDPSLELRTETSVETVLTEPAGRRTRGLRCIGPDGQRFDLNASTVVLAAGGLETPALLLRSGFERPDIGRFLFDHAHRTLWVRVRRRLPADRGSSLTSGSLEAFRDGSFRARRTAAYLNVHNPGLPVQSGVAAGVAAGRDGIAVRAEMVDRWQRTIVLNVLLEDVPQRRRQVSLSPRRDPLGLPLTRIAYSQPTAYETGGWSVIRSEIERRLQPLGIEAFEERPGASGAHQLGSCRFGTVVDPSLRYLDLENLFIVGGSVFPTYSPAHPTLTIAALALRLGQHLVLS